MKKEERLLKKAYDYLHDSPRVNAAYLTPAAQLRRAADELEERERFMKELREYLFKGDQQ